MIPQTLDLPWGLDAAALKLQVVNNLAFANFTFKAPLQHLVKYIYSNCLLTGFGEKKKRQNPDLFAYVYI